MNWLIFRVLRQKKYFLIFLFSILAMAGIYAAIQVAPQGLNNFWFWFSLLKPIDWFFYIFFCLLFGINFALFFWRNDFKVCSVDQKAKTGFFGGLGTVASVFLPLCPQCLSFLALLAPVGFLSFLAQYRVWVLMVSTGLMAISLFVLGAFEE